MRDFREGIGMGVALMVVLTACGPSAAKDDGGGGSAAGTDGVVRSDKTRITSPIVSSDDRAVLAAGNRAFAVDLYQHVRTQADNIFISPHSISEALAMTWAGAQGNTATQMADALEFDLPQERLHPAFNELDLALASRGTHTTSLPEANGVPFVLRVVNAIWGQAAYPFNMPFLDTLAENYGAGLRVVDYSTAPEPARGTINQWVSDQTEGRIPELLPVGSVTELTRLVLTNAVYFHASWKHVFDEALTANGPFTTHARSNVTVPMMKQTQIYNYAAVNGVQAVELPYDGDEISMVVLLPDASRFDEVDDGLDATLVDLVFSSLAPQEVALSLPRFTAEFGVSLRATLMAMGMTAAFTADADLSGIASVEQLSISDVIHKAFVSVDEKGTEAAAATAVLVAGNSSTDPLDLEVNRPFIFFIRDVQTGAILFMGRVNNPAG